MSDKKPPELLPWDRCPRCGESVSRTCPDCYMVHHTARDCRDRAFRSHPFPKVES